MKKINSIIIAFIIGTLSISCEKDESIKTTCDSENGTDVTDQSSGICIVSNYA